MLKNKLILALFCVTLIGLTTTGCLPGQNKQEEQAPPVEQPQAEQPATPTEQQQAAPESQVQQEAETPAQTEETPQ